MTSIKRTVFLLIPLLILSGAPQQAEARRRPIMNALRTMGWVLFGGMAARRTLRNAKFCPECGRRLCPTCGRHVNEHGSMGRNFAGNGRFPNGGMHNGGFPGGPGQNPWGVNPNAHGGGGINNPVGGGNIAGGGGKVDDPPQPGGAQTALSKDNSGKKSGATDTEEAQIASLKMEFNGKQCQGAYVDREELAGKDSANALCNFYFTTTAECIAALTKEKPGVKIDGFAGEVNKFTVGEAVTTKDGRALFKVDRISCAYAKIDPITLADYDEEATLDIYSHEGKKLTGKKRDTGKDDPVYNLDANTKITAETQGAPVLNAKGEMVGIVKATLNATGDNNFGFALSNKKFIEDVLKSMKEKNDTKVAQGTDKPRPSQKSVFSPYSPTAGDKDTSDVIVPDTPRTYGNGLIGPPAPTYGKGLIGPPVPPHMRNEQTAKQKPVYGPVYYPTKVTVDKALDNPKALPKRPRIDFSVEADQPVKGKPADKTTSTKPTGGTKGVKEGTAKTVKRTKDPVFVNGVLQPGFLRPVREVKTGGTASAPITMSPR